MTPDVKSLTSLSNEARQAVLAAVDALEQWRNEIVAANERCLTKVLDQVTNAHRALGWPERATAAAREHFLNAAKLQSGVIEHATDMWQQQLKAQNARSGVPGLIAQAPAPFQFTMPVSEMMRFGEMTLAPFKLWIEAAETWQRSWITAMSGGAPREVSSMTKAFSTQPPEPSMRESGPS
jgi:hypothetical protein